MTYAAGLGLEIAEKSAIALRLGINPAFLLGAKTRMIRADIAVMWMVWCANQAVHYVDGTINGPWLAQDKLDRLYEGLELSMREIMREFRKFKLHLAPAIPHDQRRDRAVDSPDLIQVMTRTGRDQAHRYGPGGPFGTAFD